MLRYRLHGFTLIQLLVVLAIIILAGLAFLAFQKTMFRAAQMSAFPWLPPRASAFDIVPRDLLFGEKQTPVLGDVDEALDSAFRQVGYVEKSYYSVPNGFAMVSQLEQINQDGTAKEKPADRWSVEVAPLRQWSLRAYLESLLKASPGRYRVIVFVVTSDPFTESNTKLTESDVRTWKSSGQNRLPADIASRPYLPAHACIALIYEFSRVGAQPAVLVAPSQMTGETHLAKSGLLDALKRRAIMHLLVRHKVSDFATWKKVYDAHLAARQKAGIKEEHLFHNADDPNEVVMLFSVEDFGKAKAFTESDDLRQVMEKAGVIGKPDVYFFK